MITNIKKLSPDKCFVNFLLNNDNNSHQLRALVAPILFRSVISFITTLRIPITPAITLAIYFPAISSIATTFLSTILCLTSSPSIIRSF